MEEKEKEVINETEEIMEEEEVLSEEENLQDELEDLKDRHLRLQAEYQNYRKRTDKEKNDIYRYANEKIIVDLLPFLDNFDRAIEAVSQAKNQKAIAKGIEKLKKSFLDFLVCEGVTEIDTKGDFDPNKHHAVIAEEVEGVEEGKILEELQKGYEYNERVIRPSMVKVSK